MKAIIIQGQGKKCEADKVLIRATINVWLIVMFCTTGIIRQQIFLFLPHAALCHMLNINTLNISIFYQRLISLKNR